MTEQDQPKYASVQGVRYSDITRNLMVAVVEEIGAGKTVEAIATFTAFLQAIGYSEYTEEEVERAAQVRGKFIEDILRDQTPPPVPTADDLTALEAQVAEAQGLNDERKRRIAVEIVRDCNRIARYAPLNDEGQALVAGADALKVRVGVEIFGMDPAEVRAASRQ